MQPWEKSCSRLRPRLVVSHCLQELQQTLFLFEKLDINQSFEDGGVSREVKRLHLESRVLSLDPNISNVR